MIHTCPLYLATHPALSGFSLLISMPLLAPLQEKLNNLRDAWFMKHQEDQDGGDRGSGNG